MGQTAQGEIARATRTLTLHFLLDFQVQTAPGRPSPMRDMQGSVPEQDWQAFSRDRRLLRLD